MNAKCRFMRLINSTFQILRNKICNQSVFINFETSENKNNKKSPVGKAEKTFSFRDLQWTADHFRRTHCFYHRLDVWNLKSFPMESSLHWYSRTSKFISLKYILPNIFQIMHTTKYYPTTPTGKPPQFHLWCNIFDAYAVTREENREMNKFTLSRGNWKFTLRFWGKVTKL